MKMLAEESSLYDWIKLGSSLSKDDARVLRRKVREVTRAVREDERGIVERECSKETVALHSPPR